MLHYSKNHISVILACLFLYPVIFQSIHIFEHKQEQGMCCDHCTTHSQEYTHMKKPLDEFPEDSHSFSEKSDACPVCDFHYTKYQVIKTLRIYVTPEIFADIYHDLFLKPFIIFQGYIFSLRAPPLF